jgi:16S rRNA (cytosine967-C5)-methyltransferase
MADGLLVEGWSLAEVESLFNGARFAPEPLTAPEAAFARALEGQPLEPDEMPEAVRLEIPPWAEDALRAALAPNFAAEAAALRDEAPLDLRANLARGSRDDARLALQRDGVPARPTPHSPLGLRAPKRVALPTLDAFRNGLVEVQDEGSQLVGILLGARPGEQAIDFCAGAGGKTLTIAAGMGNKGRVIAADVLDRRLKRAQERFKRAGLFNIQIKPLSGERDPWVKKNKFKFDRVLIDAPCSGTGTWRRNPDSRWRYLGPELDELKRLQAEILDSAARLAKPGGRLVYATCSLLPEENEDQVDAFLAGHPDFEAEPLDAVWAETVVPLGGTETPPCPGPWLRLTPAAHGTDGFFAAVLRRKPA